MIKNKNIRNQKLSNFYCTQCGHRGIPIQRKKGKEKEPGHLKKLYCIYCGKEQNMIEIKQNGRYTYKDFKIEFDNGNFDSYGNRKVPYKQFLAEIG